MRLAATVVVALLPASLAAAATPDWVARSNVYAGQVLDDAGRFRPEFAARTGRDKFDAAVADYGPGFRERAMAQAEKRVAELKAALAQEKDVRVRQDLEILIDTSERNLASNRLRHKMLLEYVDAAGTVVFGLSSLLDARNPPERQARALVRMHRYAGLEPGYVPIATLARERTEEELARTGLIGPYADEVRQNLANVDLYLESEAAATPAPHMQAPRLIGNTGEHGEFVIVTSNPHAKSGAPMDDFGYDAATWTLTAHEARPGHELQFDSMVERGVSITRAVFAFNSANAEGWGLYSEAIVFPYMPPEGQLVALQFRLLRAARALLDPMVNLGLVTHDDAKRVLMDDVVLSEPFAQEEADRFAFWNPGQATSYFYGFQKLRALRTRVEIALGPRFDAKAFHDFILDQGLLPPPLLERAMLEEFVPSQRAAIRSSLPPASGPT